MSCPGRRPVFPLKDLASKAALGQRDRPLVGQVEDGQRRVAFVAGHAVRVVFVVGRRPVDHGRQRRRGQRAQQHRSGPCFGDGVGRDGADQHGRRPQGRRFGRVVAGLPSLDGARRGERVVGGGAALAERGQGAAGRRRGRAVEGTGCEVTERPSGRAGAGRHAGPGREEAAELARRDGRLPALLAAGIDHRLGRPPRRRRQEPHIVVAWQDRVNRRRREVVFGHDPARERRRQCACRTRRRRSRGRSLSKRWRDGGGKRSRAEGREADGRRDAGRRRRGAAERGGSFNLRGRALAATKSRVAGKARPSWRLWGRNAMDACGDVASTYSWANQRAPFGRSSCPGRVHAPRASSARATLGIARFLHERSPDGTRDPRRSKESSKERKKQTGRAENGTTKGGRPRSCA